MIAVVTSTLKPADNKSYYTHRERVKQTIGTLTSLKHAGFNEIYLIDNSPQLDVTKLKQLLSGCEGLNIYHIEQYQFNNKGINELMMLLYLCRFIPADQSIFKISGRYVTNAAFSKPQFNDIAVKDYDVFRKNGTISTRGYWIKNAALFETFLEQTLREVFAYPERVVGLRSLLKKTTALFRQQKPLNISIELAAANVLKRSKYDVTFLNELNIEGLIAGSDKIEKIIE